MNWNRDKIIVVTLIGIMSVALTAWILFLVTRVVQTI